MKRKVISLILAIAMIASVAPMVAFAKPLDPISYIDETGTAATCSSYSLVETGSIEWTDGWWAVTEDVTVEDTVLLKGDVNLILGNNSKLTITGTSYGIYDEENGYTLNIFVQSKNNGGMLEVTAAPDVSCAGISVANINVYGGEISSTGSAGKAAISGCGANTDAKVGGDGIVCSTINVYSGSVLATGGYAGAGFNAFEPTFVEGKSAAPAGSGLVGNVNIYGGYFGAQTGFSEDGGDGFKGADATADSDAGDGGNGGNGSDAVPAIKGDIVIEEGSFLAQNLPAGLAGLGAVGGAAFEAKPAGENGTDGTDGKDCNAIDGTVTIKKTITKARVGAGEAVSTAWDEVTEFTEYKFVELTVADVPPCTYKYIALTPENGKKMSVYIAGKNIGEYTFEKTCLGWYIKDADGNYLSIKDGKLSVGKTKLAWLYVDGGFKATVATTVKTQAKRIGLVYIPATSTNVIFTYYLSTGTAGKPLSIVWTPATLEVTVAHEAHTLKTVKTLCGTKTVCKNCGKEIKK